MRIFLAAPFTGMLRQAESGGVVCDSAFQAVLESIERTLVSFGHSVFLAHRREEFGAALMAADRCTPLDMLELQRADCVVALVGRSFGVHVEIGWAAAIGIPLVLLLRFDGEATTPLLSGLSAAANCTIVCLLDETGSLSSDAHRELADAIDAAVEQRPRRRLRRVAYVTTAFGFGPASKAAAIAEAMKEHDSETQLDFFGNGIDYEFAARSGVYDRLYRLDVDDPVVVAHLVPLLDAYDAAVVVINPLVAEAWPKGGPPLYYVDSLAWMWSTPPAGLDKAARYFAQDFLLPRPRVDAWGKNIRIQVVPPIISTSARTGRFSIDASVLLVNFAGCANPFTPTEQYLPHATLQIEAILRARPENIKRIVVASNKGLADLLKTEFRDEPRTEFDHFEPSEFQYLLATSSLIFTTPGLTTTLEAAQLRRELRLLLPLNYSQALISERYCDLGKKKATLALSRFDYSAQILRNLPEEQGVALVKRCVAEVLQAKRYLLQEYVAEQFNAEAAIDARALEALSLSRWSEPGQHAIVKEIVRARERQSA